ncbi:MAG: hypothetical protein IJ734_09415 [Fibrobacter sp.]|nr:hypothetical protein [Fibrobacter sp.]
MKSLSVILGCACCAFLLACSDDGSTTSVLDNPYDERSSSSEEALESSSSEQVFSSSEEQSSSSKRMDLTSSSVASSESNPQSSSSQLSSSSLEESSSSVDDTDSTLTYERECGSLVDQRDGKSYCTVKIGTQTWMGENLDYDVPGSACIRDSLANCEKFGRLYTYAQAMGRAEDECGPGWMCKGNFPLSPGICPEGWTVPTQKDWLTLEAYVDKHNGSEPVYISLMAKPEDSKRDDITIGSDLSGFRILVSGIYDPTVESFSDSTVGFWSSTEESVNHAYRFGFDLYNFDIFDLQLPAWKKAYRYVRCIRNKE